MPITALPVEILARIFQKLRDTHIPLRSHRWLYVTHVCRSWRLIALDAASLWSCIYSSNANCVATFLVRSKKAPLNIHYAAMERRKDVTVTSMILAESYRFRHVELARSGEAHEFLEHRFLHGTPSLETLILVHISFPDLWVQTPVEDSLRHVIPDICTHGLPALQRLELECWPVASLASIRGLINSSLRSLVICRPYTRFTLHEWSVILVELPLLENLALTCVFHIRDPQDELKSQLLPLIQLPHLQSLGLMADSWKDQLLLLRNIAPSTNVTRFNFYPRESRMSTIRPIPYDGYIDILDAINDRLMSQERREAIPPNYLDIQMTRITAKRVSVEVTLRDSDYGYCPRLKSRNDVFTPPTFRLKLDDVDLAQHRAPHKYLCNILCKSFSLEKLSMLRLDSVDTAKNPSQEPLLRLQELFMELTNIRFLYIGRVSKDYVCNYLSTLLGVSNAGIKVQNGAVGTRTKSQVLFPALEVLTFDQSLPHTWLSDLEPLRLALQSRKAAGYPIPRLHICRGSDDMQRSGKPTERSSLELNPLPLTSLGCTIDHCVVD
ncbi:hypothetical protein EIP86_009921 [Pleurotus ostreatoroseus]|nr:hypothetical protein EIP86_009921 [Pleurotus ostreatoroseus]